MKRKTLILTAALVALLGLMTLAQGQGGNTAPPKISKGEQDLVQKITSAPDAAAKLKAAGDLIKAHPKTAIRGQVAQAIADQITDVKDATQKLALAQQFQTMFNDPADEEFVGPVVIDAHADANEFDQAFTKGVDFLSRHPESLRVLITLLSVGTDQAKKQNAKFIDQAIRYAGQAIALTEANKKPANFDEAGWQQFKTSTLPSIYKSLGLLYMLKGANAEAKANYTKAAQLAPSDPFNYLMLGAVLDQEYNDAAKRYQSMPAGPTKDAELRKVLAAMDAVIDAHAHMLALSEGNQIPQEVRKQVLQDFETYYKYRHNNSTIGMQQLIDKYKFVAKP